MGKLCGKQNQRNQLDDDTENYTNIQKKFVIPQQIQTFQEEHVDLSIRKKQNSIKEKYDQEKNCIKEESQEQIEQQDVLNQINIEMPYQEQVDNLNNNDMNETEKDNITFSGDEVTLKEISHINLAEELTEKKREQFFNGPRN